MARFSSTVIAYTVDKVVNNDLYISVQNGEVTVKAPWYLSKNQIQEVIEEKKNWITHKLKECETVNVKECVQEQNNIIKTTKIFGKIHYIKISYKTINIPEVTVENKNIKIILPREYKKTDNTKIIQLLLNMMYEKIAKKEMESYMEKFRIMLGFAPEDYEVKKMKNCLGKCSKENTLTIHPRIMMYDKRIIEYIIVHEFCHLKYKTHSKNFYELLEKYVPDYINYAAEINNVQY